MLAMAGSLLQALAAIDGGEPFAALVDIDLDGVNHLRVAFFDADVVYGGQTYSATSGVPAVVTVGKDARCPAFQLAITHADENFRATLDPYLRQAGGLEGQDLTAVVVNTEHLAEDYSDWTTVYTIRGHQDDDETVTFEIGAPNLYSEPFPDRRYLPVCDVAFAGPECGYAGDESECDHTLARCRELGNETRFGGSPGMRHGTLRVLR